MKIKRIRLKGLIIPSVCLFLISLIFYSGYKVWELVKEENDNIIPVNYVDKTVKEHTYPTVSIQTSPIKPFVDENVKIAIPYYNINDNENNQQSALIFYENIYMPSTGILYTSDNEFNVVSSLDGTVKDIKEDPIMGKIVEIEHNKKLITIYQSLGNVNVSVGQNITQGEIIGISGHNNIIENSKYGLNFEVYKDSELINPEDFYQMSNESLNA
jgi:stage II sporulation protein Q